MESKGNDASIWKRPRDCEAVKTLVLVVDAKKSRAVASIVGGIAALVILTPFGMWLKAKQDDWSTAFYLFVCAVLFSLIYLAARWMDKREAARSRKVADQLRRHGFDLSPTDYRSQSLRETRE
ncbi:hypothetical protein O3W52_04380 [Ensifer psoraleae]|uniref:Transmembrane protein n=1 Tax=Sinorhizobium psoraleae TaxID=520838 RepID=A0ABT4KE96_9HYPH|nr:hypothetical protein [Sinorhizobium psoraleae]